MNWRDEVKNYVFAAASHLLTEHSPQSTQPLWIKPTLRPHQLTLLQAAQNLEQLANVNTINLQQPTLISRYGVIADRVGSGKSLVALSLVKDPPPASTDIKMTHTNEHNDAMILGMKKMPEIMPFQKEWATLKDEALENVYLHSNGKCYTNTSLMVVPHNICQQWEKYIADQTTINAYIVKRTKDCDYDVADFFGRIFTSDLVVVSCTMLRKFMRAVSWKFIQFNRIVWSRLYVDEADSIHLPVRRTEIEARFTWFITGSWMNMLFPHGMYSFNMGQLPADVLKIMGDGGIAGTASSTNLVTNTLYKGRDPRFLDMILRNSEEWINKSIVAPTVNHTTVICEAPANLNVLRSVISPAAMEALHAGDIQSAMTALGLKSTSQESIVESVTASLRSEIRQQELLIALKKEMTYSTEAVKRHAIEREEQKLRELQQKLADLEVRVSTLTTQNCPICYDVPQNPALTPCCKNSFCLACVCECISKNPTCPLCRQKITSVSKLIVVGAEDGTTKKEVSSNEHKPLTKGAALLKLLSESKPEDRFLVFSSHEASFKGLREILKARGIKCEMLMGSGARVEKIRSQFREGKVRVLCMNARHIGAGINLENATHVVLYHRMNVELEKQVIGRAIRFERIAPLEVVHLVHDQETAMNGGSSSEVIVHM